MRQSTAFCLYTWCLHLLSYFVPVTSQQCSNVGTRWKTITSPGWPEPYASGSNCLWRQQGFIPGISPSSTTVRISIKYWGVNPSDRLEIFNGYLCNYFISSPIRTIGADFKTGDMFQDNIFINGNEACLDFSRDSNIRDGRAKGFQIEAKSLPRCGGALKDISGEIISDRYPRSNSLSRCQWKILSGKPGQRIKLSFLDIEMQKSQGCTSEYLRVGHGDLEKDSGFKEEDICDMAQTEAGAIITDSYSVTLLYVRTQRIISRGFWLKFEVIGCPVDTLPQVDNVISDFKENKSAFYNFGYNLTLICKTNFTSSGRGNHVTVTCLDDRTWKVLDKCVEIKCDHLKSPDDGNVTLTSGISLGSVAIFKCNTGYSLQGSNTRACDTNGTYGIWTGIQPKCLKQCTFLNVTEIVNGVLSSNASTVGAAVLLNCNKGYFVNGTSSIECLSNGAWSADLGSCQAITCRSLGQQMNGRVSNLNTSVGTAVELKCDFGYFLNESSSVACLSNGSWNGTLGGCKEIRCPDLIKPNNGSLSSGNISIGAEVEVICDDGFYVNGTSVLRCLPNGLWSDASFGKCTEITCPSLVKPSNGALSSVDTSIGEQIELICDEGFYVNGSSVVTCLSNGAWNDTSLGKCTEKTCPALEKPDNGTLSNVKISIGVEVELICDNGFYVNGTSVLICLSNGTWNDTSLGKCTEMEIQGTTSTTTDALSTPVFLATTEDLTSLTTKRRSFVTTDDSTPSTLISSFVTTDDSTPSTLISSFVTSDDSTPSTLISSFVTTDDSTPSTLISSFVTSDDSTPSTLISSFVTSDDSTPSTLISSFVTSDDSTPSTLISSFVTSDDSTPSTLISSFVTTDDSTASTLISSFVTTDDSTPSTLISSFVTTDDSTASTLISSTKESAVDPRNISSEEPPNKSTLKPSVVAASENIFSRNKGVLTGMIIGVVVIILLLTTIIALLWKHRKSKLREPPIDYYDDDNNTLHNPTYEALHAPGDTCDSKTLHKSTNTVKSNDANIPEPDYDVVDHVPVYYARYTGNLQLGSVRSKLGESSL